MVHTVFPFSKALDFRKAIFIALGQDYKAFYNIAFIQILRGRFVESEETLQDTISAYHAIVGEQSSSHRAQPA